jgi:putative transposase
MEAGKTRLAGMRGLPEVITADNDSEFAGKAMDEWAYRRSVKLNSGSR